MIYRLDEEGGSIREMAALGAGNYGSQNDISDPRFLEWQSLENPYGTAQTALAETDEGEVIGTCTQVPYKLCAFGTEITATCVVNTLIRKQDRGLPVFYALHKLSFDACAGNALAYAVPNPNSYPLFVKLFSFVTVTQIPLLVYPMRPRALARKKISSAAGAVLPGLKLRGRRFRVPGNVSIAELDSGAVTDFFDCFPVKGKYPIMGTRTAGYMKWRYLDNPRNKYKIFAVWEAAAPAGFIAVRIMEVDGIINGMIVDFLTLPGRRGAALALISHCMDYFSKEGVELAGALMLPHCEEYGFLKTAGFSVCPERYLPQPFPLIVKTFSAGGESYYDEKNWFITMGDYDAV